MEITASRNIHVSIFKLVRPKQWAKNIFVFAPLPFLLRTNVTQVGTLVLLFAAFCLAASSVYVVNDISDRERDRAHPNKRFRPIASGAVPVPLAYGLTVGLAGVSLMIGYFGANPRTAIGLTLYLTVSHLYTFQAKHLPFWDLMFVGSLYGIRTATGFVAVGIKPNGWLTLVLLAVLLAFLVELGKRKSETVVLGSKGHTRKTLSFYSDQRNLHTLYGMGYVLTVLLYPLGAWQIGGPILATTVILVIIGIYRFWGCVGKVTHDIHPQEVIFKDPYLRVILGIFVIVFCLSTLF